MRRSFFHERQAGVPPLSSAGGNKPAGAVPGRHPDEHALCQKLLHFVYPRPLLDIPFLFYNTDRCMTGEAGMNE